MNILDRKPALRWLAPLALVAVVGGAGGVVATATATDRLPKISAQELLVHLQQSKVDALSGTVVQDSDLGLPSLPGVGGSGDASLSSLVSGSHTLDVWYAGPDKARLRVQGTLDESDVIRNGSDVWSWSYKDKTATHRTIPAEQSSTHQAPAGLPQTPQEAASKFLAAVDPTTSVTTDGTAKVAGRSAYELVLAPKDANSLVSQVRIAVDGTTFVPLRVEVIATDDKPAFQVAYTAISFKTPDAAQFDFKAPPGTKVTEAPAAKGMSKGMSKGTAKAPSTKELKAEQAKQAAATKVVGHGWSSVVVTKMPAAGKTQGSAQLTQVTSALPKVSGSWGSGRLVSGTAFSAVLTDDGRVALGSVKPALLYAALSK